MKKKQWIVAAAGLVLAVGLGSECGRSMEKIDVIGGVEEPIEIVLDGESGDDDVESSEAGLTETQIPEASVLMEQLAGSSWRLADKTEEHLKQYGSLQEIWGTGIHYAPAWRSERTAVFPFILRLIMEAAARCRSRTGRWWQILRLMERSLERIRQVRRSGS